MCSNYQSSRDSLTRVPRSTWGNASLARRICTVLVSAFALGLFVAFFVTPLGERLPTGRAGRLFSLFGTAGLYALNKYFRRRDASTDDDE